MDKNMNKEMLLEYIKELPDDAEICLSHHIMIDEKEEAHAVLDMPIVGIAYSPSGNEIRFVLKYENDYPECIGKFIAKIQ